jgi:predicted permease
VRERLTGAVLLSLVGGACGMVLAFWGTRLLATMAANLDNIPRLEQTRIDARVLLFALLLSLITSLAFGLVPALQAVRVDLQSLVKEASGRAAGGLRSKQMRSVLLVSEVALALVLLVGAGLLGQSFWRLIQVAPGFRPEQCLAMRVVLPQGAPEATQIAFARRVLESLREVPSVRAAGLITNVPLTSSRLAGPVWIETSPPPIPGHEPTVDLDSVSPGFLEALGTPLIDGRSIQSSDRANTPGVAVVNRKMAERFWPGSDAIGKRISLEGPSGPWTTVVGVAGDIKRDGLDQEVGAQVYLPFEQQPAFFMTFVLRTAGDPAGVVAEARRAVWGVDPSQAVAWVRPMTDVVSASISKLRFVTALLALFAAIALVLAAVGMYGVMAHSVSQRSQEIAVRIALGAQRHDVVRMVMSNALSMTLIGLALGLACASVLTRFLKSVIFGVSATDPLTFAAISLLVIGMALTSTYIPARRAARVVPSRALKRE